MASKNIALVGFLIKIQKIKHQFQSEEQAEMEEINMNGLLSISSISVMEHFSILNSHLYFLFHRKIHDAVTCSETLNGLLSQQCCAAL